jgi:ubiquinone/menaquinone biosynthesis C-methylase UbiE
MGFLPTDRHSITLFNRRVVKLADPRFSSVVGDARRLPFANAEFDVVFSNSVIEHVGDYGDQYRMAQEIRRVGKRYFVQTPNRYFPIEPHVVLPFFQFLPLSARVWLVSLLRMQRIEQIRRISTMKAKFQRYFGAIRLLSRYEIKQLFPEATVQAELFCGLAKSFMAYGGWPDHKRIQAPIFVKGCHSSETT